MALFGGKGFKIEVVDGIDIESAITLNGEKMTVGTGAGDTLRLGEADVVPAQLTFQMRGGAWEYFVADRGRTVVKGGHPRAGKVAVGQEYALGGSARLKVIRTEAPEPITPPNPDGTPAAPVKKTIPLAVALPVLGLFVLGALAVAQLVQPAREVQQLATTRWFVQAEPLADALASCLAGAADLPDQAVARSAPDWAFRAALRGDPAADGALQATVTEMIAEAHFLHDGGDSGAAADLYRRMENVIPVGNRECPILAATRRDLAVMEMAARR